MYNPTETPNGATNLPAGEGAKRLDAGAEALEGHYQAVGKGNGAKKLSGRSGGADGKMMKASEPTAKRFARP